jgi:hypothetical protein
MLRILQSLIENCHLEVERTDKGWRLTGEGPLGVFGLLFLVLALVYWGITAWMT